MMIRFAHVAAAALVAVVALAAPEAKACDSAPVIRQDTVQASLSLLMQREGLASATPTVATIRRVDLDNDATTEEALVDIVSADLCGPALTCPTIVVLARGGQLTTAGHGTMLSVLQSSANGYRDLAGTAPTLVPFVYAVTRALRWNGFRYV